MPPRCRTAEKMLDPSEKVWSTLRCLEYQLEAHEARFHRDGDVNWQAIRHMIMAAQHEARTTGAALRRAWTDEDAVGDELAQTKLQLRETEQKLAAARSEANVQAARLVAAQRGKDQLQVENHCLAITLQCLRRFASAVQGAKQKYQFLDCQGANEEIEAALKQLQASDAVAAATVAGVKVAWSGDNVQPDPPTLDSDGRNYGPSPLGKAEAVRSEVAQLRKQLDRADRRQPPTDSPPAVTEPLDDSSGADGPGQS